MAGTPPLQFRKLQIDELDAIWTIDRTEYIGTILKPHYTAGTVVLSRHPIKRWQNGWPDGEQERYAPVLAACFDRGGAFLGAFDDQEQLHGVVVLDAQAPSAMPDARILKFLYVDRSARGQGLGQRLLDWALNKAKIDGARALCVSSTETEATVRFYLRCGFQLWLTPDPDMRKAEPRDVFMIQTIEPDRPWR